MCISEQWLVVSRTVYNRVYCMRVGVLRYYQVYSLFETEVALCGVALHIIMGCEITGEDPKGPPAKLLVLSQGKGRCCPFHRSPLHTPPEDLIKGISKVNIAGNQIIILPMF